MDLSLDQLKVLVTVADTGSLSAAARKLRRAQSSVSYAIATLEEKLDVVLLDRNGYRPTFTPQGESILAEARTLLAGIDRLASLAAKMENRKVEPKVALCVDEVIAPSTLSDVLADFAMRFSATQLIVRAESRATGLALLRDGECDLAVIAFGDERLAPGLVKEELWHIAFEPVAAPHHPIAQLAGPLQSTVLRQHLQLVLSERDAEAFKEKGNRVMGGATWRLMDMSTRHALVVKGVGWGYLPQGWIEADLRAGRLVKLNVETSAAPAYPIAAIYRGPRALGPATQWLVQSFASQSSATTLLRKRKLL
jgi:DNA-binding transcriptional LysR family regulator